MVAQANITFDVDFDPNISLVVSQFGVLSNRIRSFREPLDDSIRQVLIPSIRENFAVEGRPPWEPLAEATVARKGHSRILHETGKLAQRAVLIKNWTVRGGYLGDIAEANMQGVDGVDYANFHMTGTRFMPARPFASMQPQDEVAVERIFENWLTRRMVETGWSLA